MDPFRVAQRRAYERRVRRIDETVYLHDVDAAIAHGLRAGDRAHRSGDERAPAQSYEESTPPHQSVVARASYDGAMEVAEFCSTSRVVIVAGKGGVGKTTVTAAFAVSAARAGKSVLVVEVEGK